MDFIDDKILKTLIDIIDKTSRTKKFTRILVAMCSVKSQAITAMQNRICKLLVEDGKRYNELVYKLKVQNNKVLIASNYTKEDINKNKKSIGQANCLSIDGRDYLEMDTFVDLSNAQDNNQN